MRIFIRSPINSPVFKSTRAPLIPEPPTSIPKPVAVMLVSVLENDTAIASGVAGSDCGLKVVVFMAH